MNAPGHGTEGATSMQRDSTELDAATVAKFWSLVDRSGSCWIWTGGKSHGYGVFAPAYRNHHRAHRLAYELERGPIPDGLVIDHICRTPACVNPAHLEPVTQAENCRRGVGFGGINNRKTHCNEGHPLEGDNLYVDPKGRRQCKECRRDALRRHRERNPGYHDVSARQARRDAA